MYGVFLSAASASSVLGLPTGYKEDFNGCARTEDVADRKRCCKETYKDCEKRCLELYGNDLSDALRCSGECALAGNSCNKGEQIKAGIEWPGEPGITVPGVLDDGNRLVAEEGVSFKLSDHAVVIEMRNTEEQAELARCVAIIATCQCSRSPLTDGGDGTVCRLIVESNKAECHICTQSSGSEKCTPCADCTPVLLSVQPCEAPEQRGDRPANPKGTGER